MEKQKFFDEKEKKLKTDLQNVNKLMLTGVVTLVLAIIWYFYRISNYSILSGTTTFENLLIGGIGLTLVGSGYYRRSKIQTELKDIRRKN